MDRFGAVAFVSPMNEGVEGQSPAVGSCVLSGVPWQGPETVEMDPVTLEVAGVGTWTLTMGSDGYMRSLAALPDPPVLTEGTEVSMEQAGLRLSVATPRAVSITAPPLDTAIDLAGPTEVQWPAGSDPDVQIILVAVTENGGFLAQQHCIAADTGSFMLPAWDEVPAQLGYVRLHLRHRHRASSTADDLGILLNVYRVLVQDYPVAASSVP